LNIENLYSIASTVLRDFTQLSIASHLQNLTSHLQNSTKQPNQPQHQQNVSKFKTSLVEALNECESNAFNVIDLCACEELGIDGYIGQTLLNKIDQIFKDNSLTPSVASAQLVELNGIVTQKIAALTKVQQGFNELGLSEINESNSFSLVVKMPRELMDNNLAGYAKSIDSLNSNLLVFSEIATGTRESFEIGALSTSDPTLSLMLVWDAGQLILDVLSKVAAVYAGVTLLKQQRQKFIDSGAPEEKLADLTDWIKDQVKDQINAEVPPLVDKYYKGENEARKNELKIEARRKALRIAENIDNGYTFDIKQPSEPEVTDEEVSDAVDEALQQLNVNNKVIEENKIIGSNILMLPDSDDNLD